MDILRTDDGEEWVNEWMVVWLIFKWTGRRESVIETRSINWKKNHCPILSTFPSVIILTLKQLQFVDCSG
jgi:hypothetical protein